jgi:hypothetical protein
MKRGRKRVLTDEQRAERKVAAQRAWQAKTKNVTVDADLIAALNAVADKLEPNFGFRPTLSQTLRYLIKEANA